MPAVSPSVISTLDHALEHALLVAIEGVDCGPVVGRGPCPAAGGALGSAPCPALNVPAGGEIRRAKVRSLALAGPLSMRKKTSTRFRP